MDCRSDHHILSHIPVAAWELPISALVEYFCITGTLQNMGCVTI